MLKAQFNFTKEGKIRFISHLDLMRLFARAMRRAGLPIKITSGFHPHPKFSIKRALKLGQESRSEEASVVLSETLDEKDFASMLQKELPEGILINNVMIKEYR